MYGLLLRVTGKVLFAHVGVKLKITLNLFMVLRKIYIWIFLDIIAM